MDVTPSQSQIDKAPELRSGISKRWKENFVLDEKVLRRIFEILEKFAKQLSEPRVVVFHVRRADDRFYETINIEDVLSDPNISARRISSVSITIRDLIRKATQDDYELDYIPHIGFLNLGMRLWTISLEIESDNRDWALLLADELELEITKTFNTNRLLQWSLVGFLLPISLILIKISTSIGEATGLGIACLLAIGVIYFVIAVWVQEKESSAWVKRWFGPENVFLWGEEGRKYLVREATRKKVLWGAVATFIISTIASTLWLVL